MSPTFPPFSTTPATERPSTSSLLLTETLTRLPDIDGPFTLEQNYPNPFRFETTVPFSLPFAADVHLNLFDHLGRKVAGVVRKGRGAGPQTIKLNLEGLGLPAGDYTYQLQVSSRHGLFRQSRLMTQE